MGADYNEFKENYRKLLSRHNEFLTENQARDTLRTGLSQTSQDAKVVVATFTITRDDAIWQGKTAYWAHNDTWGRRKLRNGTDYTQSVTVSPATFPAATVLTWSWPNRASPDGVWGYPSIAYGHANGGGIPSPNGKAFTPVQIKNAQAMTATFGWTPGPQGASFDYDVLLETYLTSAPNGKMLFEIGFFLHGDPTEAKTDPSHLTYTGPNYVATIVKWPGGFPGVPFIMVILDRSIRSGLFNMLPVVRFLVEKGWLSGEEYFSGMEFGCEPFRGSGSVTIDRLSYDLR